MKKILLCISVILAVQTATSVMAAEFSPVKLEITADPVVQYGFGNEILNLPVTVSGTDAGLVFCVFTRGRSGSIGSVTNGHLGWHHVNLIDTCVYASPPLSFKRGQSVITWDGRATDGGLVPMGEYTYYIFGYDNTGSKTQASAYIRPDNNGTDILELDEDGLPLTYPIIHTVTSRWRLGSDAYNADALQRTTLPRREGWTAAKMSAVDPKNPYKFYVQLVNFSTKSSVIAKYAWVPGSTSLVETDFGDGGYSESFSVWPGDEPGVITDGEYLYTGDSAHEYDGRSESMFYIFDFDGYEVDRIDLEDWWSSSDDYNAGGFTNGGPNTMSERNGKVFLNSFCSCVKQMVDPIRGLDEGAFFVWTNANGDYVFDKNFDDNVLRPWICNDDVAPFSYNLDADANLFSIGPAYGAGMSSFGLLAPDGTGLGYFAFSGETSGPKLGCLIVDSGSAYDGIYCDNESAYMQSSLGYGSWYIAHDSISGVIAYVNDVEDEAPSTFTLSTNYPNPFNPATSIPFTLAGESKVTLAVYNVAGHKVATLVDGVLDAGAHEVTWDASDFASGVYFCRLETDGMSKTVKMTLMK